jgi:hypothetical protein
LSVPLKMGPTRLLDFVRCLCLMVRNQLFGTLYLSPCRWNSQVVSKRCLFYHKVRRSCKNPEGLRQHVARSFLVHTGTIINVQHEITVFATQCTSIRVLSLILESISNISWNCVSGVILNRHGRCSLWNAGWFFLYGLGECDCLGRYNVRSSVLLSWHSC